MVIIIDTSVFIEYSRTKTGPLLSLLRQQLKVDSFLTTSTIVLYEFWSGMSMNRPESVFKAEKIFKDIEVIPVTTKIAKKAGELVRHGFCTGNDALIAATALEANALLATLNTKHFGNVPGLNLWHPKSAS